MRTKIINEQLTDLFYNFIEMEDRIAVNDRYADLNSSDMRFLSAVGKGSHPRTITQVGDYLRVGRQTAHHASSSLIRRGYQNLRRQSVCSSTVAGAYRERRPRHTETDIREPCIPGRLPDRSTGRPPRKEAWQIRRQGREPPSIPGKRNCISQQISAMPYGNIIRLPVMKSS